MIFRKFNVTKNCNTTFHMRLCFFQAGGNGSDSCSCVTVGEDCTSERVRFDDNISFIASHTYEAEKPGIFSNYFSRCNVKSPLARQDRVYDTLSNDSIYIDMIPPNSDEMLSKPQKKHSSTTAMLRNQFFYPSLNEGKSKSLDDKTIIEVSTETLDVPSSNRRDVETFSKSENLVIESSKL